MRVWELGIWNDVYGERAQPDILKMMHGSGVCKWDKSA